jgi:hypothetical protein
MGKTYLEANPDARMLLLDECTSVGGTWATERLYPGLKTNNLEGGYEFSDFPMQGQTRYGLQHDQHIPGTVMNQYMRDFANHFGLSDRVRLRCKAHTVKRLDDGTWLVKYSTQGGETQAHTRKLVIATGLTNAPFIPVFEGQETFGRQILHVKDRATYDVKADSIVLLNATKSSFDAAYAYAKRGVQVHWIIRKSGHGPCWMSPARVTPLKKRLEDIGCVRFISWLSPCIWSGHEGFGWLRGFLQQTRIGRKLVSAIWGVINQDVVALSRYDEHPETAKLKPWGDVVWYACTLGIFNYEDDFMSLIRDGSIEIYDDDIDHLSPDTVHLSSGIELSAGALICSTGWDHRPSLKFEPPSLAAELGIPSSKSAVDPSLVAKANAYIKAALPWLTQNSPVINVNYKPLSKVDPETKVTVSDPRTEPYRLFRFVVPPKHLTSSSPSIAFLGFTWAIPTVMVAQAAALWITAFFEGSLEMQKSSIDPEQVLWETTLHTQFAQLRYPGGFGARFPDMAFEAVPFVDMLMGDLGLEKRRKKGGSWLSRVWRETWEHYSIRDYEGLVQEWLAKRSDKKRPAVASNGSIGNVVLNRGANGHAKAD